MRSNSERDIDHGCYGPVARSALAAFLEDSIASSRMLPFRAAYRSFLEISYALDAPSVKGARTLEAHLRGVLASNKAHLCNISAKTRRYASESDIARGMLGVVT